MLKNAVKRALPFLPLFVFMSLASQVGKDSSATLIPKKIYTTAYVSPETAPEIDGNPNDIAWDTVDWAGDYLELQPDPNSSPSEETKFKIVYDDKNLYLLFRCFDKDPAGIVKRMSRRDGFEGDFVEVNIDSYHDKRTAFSFTASSSGVKGDEFVSNNGNNWDTSWNPIWYLKTSIDAEGWIAEIKIPFSQLRFGNADEQVWGLQSTRRYFRAAERSTWQPIPLNSPNWVSEFGELHGLKGLKPQKQLEIQPYTVASLETYEKENGNPFKDGSDERLTGGLDAKIGITNDLTLDLTINPDFGQVEADPAAIALDGFQIFFAEQRPFFVENKNIFDFQLGNNSFDNLFYSRRIGRNPQGFVTDENAVYKLQPTNSTILGAAKFSGKTKNGWSLGLLESLTAKEYAKTIDINGNRSKSIVEPLTNYLVGRAQKDFNDRNSFIGGVFTATNRSLEPEVDFLHKAAYSGGIDFMHNWKDRRYFVEGKFMLSHVTGSEEAIRLTQESITHLFGRVDASHVEIDPNRTSLTGTGGRLAGGRAGGGNWRYGAGIEWRSPELELNDIGFLRQADEIRQTANLGYRTTKPFGIFRLINTFANQFSTYDFEGNFNRIQYDLGSYLEYKNNWWSEIGYTHKPRIFINTFLRGGPRWRYNEENVGFLFFGSDQRKKFSFTMGHVYSQATQNNFSFQNYTLRLRYQPLDAMNISIQTEFEKNPNKTQYVTQVQNGAATRYIMGNIDQQTLVTSLRINYNINPNLTLQYYGQPFISRGRYTDFNFVNNSIASDLNERVTMYSPGQINFDETEEVYNIDENEDGTTDYSFGNPDFSFVQFRSNLVLRWEYIPGSEVFLVWSQGVTEFGDPRDGLFTALDRNILGTQPQNIFLIKATYRFVL